MYGNKRTDLVLFSVIRPYTMQTTYSAATAAAGISAQAGTDLDVGYSIFFQGMFLPTFILFSWCWSAQLAKPLPYLHLNQLLPSVVFSVLFIGEKDSDQYHIYKVVILFATNSVF